MKKRCFTLSLLPRGFGQAVSRRRSPSSPGPG